MHGELKTEQLYQIVFFIFAFYNGKRNNPPPCLALYCCESGRQATVSYFLDNKDDGARMVVFLNHADLWSDIKDDVRAFTLANWAGWEVEKPDWFTEGFKAGVTDDYMPKGALDELNRTSVGGKRRRSSVGLLMLEGAGTSTDGTGRNCEDDCAATG